MSVIHFILLELCKIKTKTMLLTILKFTRQIYDFKCIFLKWDLLTEQWQYEQERRIRALCGWFMFL